MKLASVSLEAIRNVIAHRVLSVACASFALLCSFSAIAASIVEYSALDDRNDALIARGANVWVVTGAAPLSAERCDSSAAIIGVLASGGVMASASSSVVVDDRHWQTVTGTPGLAMVYWPDLADGPNNVIFGESLWQRYGLSDGSRFELIDSRARSVLVTAAPTSERSPHFAELILEMEPPSGTVRECLVEAVPGAKSEVEAALLAWFQESSPETTPYLSDQVLGSRPSDDAVIRPGVWYAAGAGILIFAGTLIYWRVRLTELALYRMVGLSTSRILTLLWTESLLIALVPAALGSAIAIGLAGAASDAPSLPGVAILDAARVICPLLALPVAGSLLCTRRRALERIRGA